MTITLGKGELAEEALRNYFIEHGYFVVRSLPYTYNEFDITDIDLWLYCKSSPFTRERTNVDIKNKKAPQAFERIIWTKGLQTTLGLERSIVATTSNRKEAKDFSAANDIILLDGEFLNTLTSKTSDLQRITEEELLVAIASENLGGREDSWKKRYLTSKARLLTKLNFDGCNEYLKEIHYFLEQTVTRAGRSTAPIRCLYINIAFFLICVDFIAKHCITLDQKSSMTFLSNGFNYGERGKERTESITSAAIKLASSVIASSSISSALQLEIDKQLRGRPVEILADFFSKNSNVNSLLNTAKQFESLSYSKSVLLPSHLPVELQGILGLLTDFFRLDRKKMLNL